MTKPNITIKDTICQIHSVSMTSTSLDIFYTITVGEAFLPNGQEILVKFPKGDEKYATGDITYTGSTNVEYPISARATGNHSINTSAPNQELLQSQVELLYQICENLNLYSIPFKLKDFKTTNYTDWDIKDEDGISIYTDNLYNGKFLKKNEEFNTLIEMLISKLIESGLVTDMKNASISTSSKVRKLLDSIFPACDMEIKVPDNAIEDPDTISVKNVKPSSKVQKILSKVVKTSSRVQGTGKEIRVFVVDPFNDRVHETNYTDLSDEQQALDFMDDAEMQGTVYDLENFQNAFNYDELDFDSLILFSDTY